MFKWVMKHPADSIELFLKELHDTTMNRMFYNFLRHKDAGKCLQNLHISAQ